MRKFTVFFLGITYILLLSTCKQFFADLEKDLAYWSSVVKITDRNVSSELTDNQGYECLLSTEDKSIVFELLNPQKYQLKSPGIQDAPSDIVVFEKGVKGSDGTVPPKAGVDYEFKQKDSGHAELIYKKDFLTYSEWGSQNLSPTITLYNQEGRRFPEKYSFKIRANTPPPALEYKALCKTQGADGKMYYVLCFEVKDMEKKAGLNDSKLLHQDIASFTFTPQGGEVKTLPLTVKENSFDISGSDGLLLPADKIEKLKPADITTGISPDELPSGNWILRFKTDVEVKKGAVKTYTIKLIDKKGLNSPEITASTSTNKLPPVILYYGNAAISAAEDEAGAHLINTGLVSDAISLQARAQNGAAISGTVEKKSGSGWTKVNDVSGTTNAEISLPALESSENEALYKITLKANAAGYSESEIKTFFVKLTKKLVVTFGVEGGQGGSLKGIYGTEEKTASGTDSKTFIIPPTSTVTFTAIPAEGWEVDSWSGVAPDASPADNTKATLSGITAAKTVRVKFKKIKLPVLKIKQSFSSDEEKNISAAATGYVTEDIIPDAAQYTETNPLVIYNINGKVRLSLTAPAGAAASYTLDGGQSSNTTGITLTTAKKYKLEVWTQKSGLQSSKTVLYVEVKNGLGSYTELKNVIKNAPVVTGGITITINTNSIDCSAEPSEIAVTGGKKLIIQSSVSSQARTINANQKGRIFKISGAGTVLTLKDIKLENGKAADGKGGAVYLESGRFIIKGASYIVPGANGKNDVYLADGTTLTVDGNLTLPAEANGIAALISTNETNAPSGYTADCTKQILSLINGAAQSDCSLFKFARATGASVTGEAASGYLSTKYGIQFESGSPAKGVITETGSSGSILPYEPSPYAFILNPSTAPIEFTQGGTSNTVTFTLKKKGGAGLDAGTQFKLKMELYQNGSSLSSLGAGKGVKTGAQNENGINITLPSWLPAGTYQLNLKAEVDGQTYDGWQAVVVN